MCPIAHPHTSQPTPTPTKNCNVRIMPMPTASPLRSGIALWASSEAVGVSGIGVLGGEVVALYNTIKITV